MKHAQAFMTAGLAWLYTDAMTSFSTDCLGLGIDAGGTQTRWALASVDGHIVGEGAVAGLSALQMSSDTGRAALQTTFSTLCQHVLAIAQPARVMAGLTGFGGDGAV